MPNHSSYRLDPQPYTGMAQILLRIDRGHNQELHVADDYEMIVRTFLKTG